MEKGERKRKAHDDLFLLIPFSKKILWINNYLEILLSSRY